ncbi:unnamed protein product [Moneuplotes crassus]|uniref:Uncharacterized protein n=1 Tax=Euplotes crassus TaxID=5936 RepID=A0AAD1Y6Q4_EUPCR|nr:unnamed protein product [Moneuplotes crassus]
MELNMPNPQIRCSSANCTNKREYICLDHKEAICAYCCDTIHYDCEVNKYCDKHELKLVVKLLHDFVKDLKLKAYQNGLMQRICGLEQVFTAIHEEFEVYDREVRQALRDNSFIQFHTLVKQARRLKSEIFEGKFGNNVKGQNPILRLLFDSELCRDNSQKVEIQNSYEFMSAVREVAKDNKRVMEEKMGREIQKAKEQIENEINQKYQGEIESLKSQIEQLNQDKARGEQIVEDLGAEMQNKENEIERGKQLSNSLNDQLEFLKTECDQVKQENARLVEEVKTNTIKLEEQSRTLQKHIGAEKCEEIYKDMMGGKVSLNSLFKLDLDLSNEKHKKLIEELGSRKIQLPNINWMKLQHMHDCTEIVDQFLLSSIPDKLSMLILNRCGTKLIDISKIMKGLLKAIPSVTQELYLQIFNFSSKDLEKIIKAAHKIPKVVFRLGQFDTQEEMDFSIDDGEYKIECLSVQYTNDKKYVTNTWDEHPEEFETIVKAIAQSGLKESLKKIKLYASIISKDKVKELLETHGLGQIDVIEEQDLEAKK